MFFAACVCVCHHYRPAQSIPLYHPPTQSHKMLPPQKEKGWTEGHPAAGTFMLPSIHYMHQSIQKAKRKRRAHTDVTSAALFLIYSFYVVHILSLEST